MKTSNSTIIITLIGK